MTKSKNKFQIPLGKSYIFVSAFITFILVFGTVSILLFVPNILLKYSSTETSSASLFFVFNQNYLFSGVSWKYGLAIVYWVTFVIVLISLFFTIVPSTRSLIAITFYYKYYSGYLAGCSEIINTTNFEKINVKVAMVVSTCNDVLPNTILQTAKQTYKNMDVWICDDSNKQDVIKLIDKFAKKHKFFVLRRPVEHKKMHPTKLGNLFYFVDKYGDKYDYVFENDSSSIVTSTFVENCLRFYYSPLLDHNKDGGIICNGSFYGTKSLLSLIFSKAWQMGDVVAIVGTTLQLSGHPVPLQGWASIYPVRVLKKIPIKDVECPSCDMARGFWLSSRGYKNYVNPFDFAAKMSTQNIEAIKNQQLKWHGAEVFLFKHGIFTANQPNNKNEVFIRFWTYQIVLSLPISTFVGLILLIVSCFLNFIYFNLASILFASIPFVLLFIVWVILLIVNKAPILSLISFVVFCFLLYFAFLYRKVYQNIVRGFIQNKWSSGAVTVKGIVKSTPKQKLRMCRLDFFIILFALALCLVLTFVTSSDQIARPLIWINIFFFVAGPSLVYILLAFVGEIKVPVGWDNDVEYSFWKHDLRYRCVKETDVWKKQHGLKY